jgi:hypothetical protein
MEISKRKKWGNPGVSGNDSVFGRVVREDVIFKSWW